MLAYRHVTVTKQEGRDEVRSEAVLYIERRGTDLIAHGVESGQVPEVLSRRWWFPTPSDPTEWVVPGEGRTSNVVRPDLVVRDRHEVTESDEGRRIVTTRVASFAPLGEARCRHEGLFDAARGRYVRMRTECTTQLDTSGASIEGMNNLQVRSTSRDESTFDAELTAARRATLAQHPRIRREARTGLDAYLESHPLEAEIARALDAGRLPPFYTESHPARVWAAVLDEDRHRPLFQDLTLPYLMGRLPEAVMPVLRARLADPDVARFVAGSTDPSLRDVVERFAGGSDAALRDQARETLRTVSREPSELRTMGLDELSRHGTRMLGVAPPERLVPVLIDILADAPEGPRAAISVQWLEALTMQANGNDVGAWRRFWAEHRDRPHRAWCLEAAGSPVPLLRAQAFRALAAHDPSDDVRARLTAALDDPIMSVRDAAARTLLAWGDDAGLDHALRALESFSLPRRHVGFEMLSRFGDHALGYAPDASEEDRVAAIARWREWSSRR